MHIELTGNHAIITDADIEDIALDGITAEDIDATIADASGRQAADPDTLDGQQAIGDGCYRARADYQE